MLVILYCRWYIGINHIAYFCIHDINALVISEKRKTEILYILFKKIELRSVWFIYMQIGINYCLTMADHLLTYINALDGKARQESIKILVTMAKDQFTGFFFGSSVAKLLIGESLGKSDIDCVICEPDKTKQEAIGDKYLHALKNIYKEFKIDIFKIQMSDPLYDIDGNFVHDKFTIISTSTSTSCDFKFEIDIIYVANCDEFISRLHCFDHLLIMLNFDGTLSAPSPIDITTTLDAYKAKKIRTTFYDSVHDITIYKQSKKQFERLIRYVIDGYQFELTKNTAIVIFNAYQRKRLKDIKKIFESHLYQLGRILFDVFKCTKYTYSDDEKIANTSIRPSDVTFICGCAVIGGDEQMFDEIIAMYGIDAYRAGLLYTIPCQLVMSYLGNHVNESLWTKVLDNANEYFDQFATNDRLPYSISLTADNKMQRLACVSIGYGNITFYNWLVSRDHRYKYDHTDGKLVSIIGRYPHCSYGMIKQCIELGLFTEEAIYDTIRSSVKRYPIYCTDLIDESDMKSFLTNTNKITLNPDNATYVVRSKHVRYISVETLIMIYAKTNVTERQEFMTRLSTIMYQADGIKCSLYTLMCQNFIQTIAENNWMHITNDDYVSFLTDYGIKQSVYLSENFVEHIVNISIQSKWITEWILDNVTFIPCFKMEVYLGEIANVGVKYLHQVFNGYRQLNALHKLPSKYFYTDCSIDDIIFGHAPVSMDVLTNVLLIKTLDLVAEVRGTEDKKIAREHPFVMKCSKYM